uniref:Aspartate aminotransferase, cytoplasmic n=1 Tax=Bactrocera dorsalis TaxID=27457 RepID=A0A034W281_BACDO
MQQSVFSKVNKGAAIEVFALIRACAKDTSPNKADLSAGTYRTNEGKPWVLPVVRKTEIKITSDETINHEYLPVLGECKKHCEHTYIHTDVCILNFHSYILL